MIKAQKVYAMISIARYIFYLFYITVSIGFSLIVGGSAFAQNRSEMLPVLPIISCSDLRYHLPQKVEGATTKVETKLLETEKGKFCQISGKIAPEIGFEIYLPTEKWTQRFIQSGCGGLCGMINASIGNANKCAIALDGQFAVAATDLGHKGQMGSPNEGAFADDLKKRIDFAYRANHLTTLFSKAAIATFYGQQPRYSYFSGCSDGGREALMEAQRYPDDFDGISAGAPAMLFQVQNSFFHAWTAAVNSRADGSHVLLASKLPVLHEAVLAHCDRLDGVNDGLLADPRLCHVKPEWVKCLARSKSQKKCLTSEEWEVVSKLYNAPFDSEGHHFLPSGVQPGSELQWTDFVPEKSDGKQMSGQMMASMANVVFLDADNKDKNIIGYPFTIKQLNRISELHPLNDATNTNLRDFAARGGKLIMWHGWSDTSIAPMISVAYYQAVQKEMGLKETDTFLRLFMIPGVSHCGGGDGFGQIDTLQALMHWVEAEIPPAQLNADKVAEFEFSKPFAHKKGKSEHEIMAIGGADGRGNVPGLKKAASPYARNGQPIIASRPIYPFPTISRYTGYGDIKQARNYRPSSNPLKNEIIEDWYGSFLLSPNFQKEYSVENGKLVSVNR